MSSKQVSFLLQTFRNGTAEAKTHYLSLLLQDQNLRLLRQVTRHWTGGMFLQWLRHQILPSTMDSDLDCSVLGKAAENGANAVVQWLLAEYCWGQNPARIQGRWLIRVLQQALYQTGLPDCLLTFIGGYVGHFGPVDVVADFESVAESHNEFESMQSSVWMATLSRNHIGLGILLRDGCADPCSDMPAVKVSPAELAYTLKSSLCLEELLQHMSEPQRLELAVMYMCEYPQTAETKVLERIVRGIGIMDCLGYTGHLWDLLCQPDDGLPQLGLLDVALGIEGFSERMADHIIQLLRRLGGTKVRDRRPDHER